MTTDPNIGIGKWTKRSCNDTIGFVCGRNVGEPKFCSFSCMSFLWPKEILIDKNWHSIVHFYLRHKGFAKGCKRCYKGSILLPRKKKTTLTRCKAIIYIVLKSHLHDLIKFSVG